MMLGTAIYQPSPLEVIWLLSAFTLRTSPYYSPYFRHPHLLLWMKSSLAGYYFLPKNTPSTTALPLFLTRNSQPRDSTHSDESRRPSQVLIHALYHGEPFQSPIRTLSDGYTRACHHFQISFGFFAPFSPPKNRSALEITRRLS